MADKQLKAQSVSETYTKSNAEVYFLTCPQLHLIRKMLEPQMANLNATMLAI